MSAVRRSIRISCESSSLVSVSQFGRSYCGCPSRTERLRGNSFSHSGNWSAAKSSRAAPEITRIRHLYATVVQLKSWTLSIPWIHPKWALVSCDCIQFLAYGSHTSKCDPIPEHNPQATAVFRLSKIEKNLRFAWATRSVRHMRWIVATIDSVCIGMWHCLWSISLKCSKWNASGVGS